MSEPSIRDLQRTRAILRWAKTQLISDEDLDNCDLMREWIRLIIQERKNAK